MAKPEKSTSKLTEAMLRPEFYPDRPGRVELRQTHISYVFLAGIYVYKVKKPIRLPFLDYSTLAKRHHFCREELRLNCRLAPKTYLDVVAIRRADGGYLLGPNDSKGGRIVEYAVKMKRLPEERMLSALLGRNQATTDHVLKIADKLAAFHRSAGSEKAPLYGSPQAVAAHVRGNFGETRRFTGRTIHGKTLEAIEAYSEGFLSARHSLLNQRIAAGRVRDGHGDLRAEHICMIDDIEIYDCVEFNEGLRYGDIASEAAFLAMDLDFAGADNLSGRFADAYARAARDDHLATLLPFYKCYRAYVRGKVESLKSEEAEVAPSERATAFLRALRYFLLARRYAGTATKPKLLAVCGMVATGKSTVARLLAARTGFAVFDSDRVRKQLAGVAPPHRLSGAYQSGIYAPEFTRRTYETLLEEASRRLQRGDGTIVAATFADKESRRWAIEMADRLQVQLLFIECRADEKAIEQRLRARQDEDDPDEASDATWPVYQRMRGDFAPFSDLPKGCHFVVDTERRLLEDLASVEEML
jgi:aminoglycoside phosphotransferase family enzyme/predicted kinase